MKVRVNVGTLSTRYGEFSRGETADLPAEDAAELIRVGWVSAVPEAAPVEAAEPKPKRRKRIEAEEAEEAEVDEASDAAVP